MCSGMHDNGGFAHILTGAGTGTGVLHYAEAFRDNYSRCSQV